MSNPVLTPVGVAGLDVSTNRRELRRDIHTFTRYVQDPPLKRSHRGNNVPKSDALRLAKMMTDPDALKEVKETGRSKWVDFIDRLALKLGFVKYDTEGSYMGYTSTEPSFPDNYVKFESAKYRRFLESSLEKQEHAILDALLQDCDHSNNEFFRKSLLGALDPFSSHGCATGVVPMLKFPKARRFLLDMLKDCRSGVWYGTESLIKHLKKAHPFFLIPEKAVVKDRWWKEGRYGNFQESRKAGWGSEIKIPERDPRAFERVEGRYVERFLEGIPLTMRYVDVAYDRGLPRGSVTEPSGEEMPPPDAVRKRPASTRRWGAAGKGNAAKLFPSIGKLKAFRVHERFLKAMKGGVPGPKVTVQPNFEVHVESEFYPARILSRLTPLAEVKADDVSIILKLKKEKVASRMVADKNLDVPSLLRELTGRDIPKNVATELEEWAGHSEIFTLYKGFALLEGDSSQPSVGAFAVESLSPLAAMVRSPGDLFAQLEKSELMPMLVKHSDAALQRMPQEARTVFAKKSSAEEPKRKPRVSLRRRTTIELRFPEDGLFERFCAKLLKARCRFEADKPGRAITFSKSQEPHVILVLKALEKEWAVRIEDVE